MRAQVEPDKLQRLMEVLGREAQGSGCIYFTGGASALLIGWRGSTVDVDIRLDPEPPGIFQAIAKIKQELNINIELASPQDFLPPLPGWRDRSKFIAQRGKIAFYHYDFTAQALSKLSRGFDRDMSDVQAMYAEKLFTLQDLGGGFEAIEPELIRFPAVKVDVLRDRVEAFIKNHEL
jgi:hypothetical protein